RRARRRPGSNASGLAGEVPCGPVGKLGRRSWAGTGPWRFRRSEAVRPADDLLHDLRGAATDRSETGVPPGSLDGELHHVAIPPVELERLVRDLPVDLRRQPL